MAMELYVPGVPQQKPTRIHSKKIWLTFSALRPSELDFDTLLSAGKRWGHNREGLREYGIGEEQHSEAADPSRATHFHAYFKFGKKVNVPDRLRTTIFDLKSNRDGRTLHPELESVKDFAGDRERVVRYFMKDGRYVSELETPLVDDPQRDAAEADGDKAQEDGGDGDADKGGPPAWAKMLNKVSSSREGMELLMERAPHIYYLNGRRIETMLTKRIGVREPKLCTLADFSRAPLDLDSPIVLHGATNCGKTEFALAHFDRPLVCRRRDDLKRLSGATDGIIFDDVDFRDWSPEDAICLLSQDKPRSLPARYSDAFIEADIPMVFTTNKKPTKIFPRGVNKAQRGAIARRYTAVRVTAPLQMLGRPFTPAEKRARRGAGQNGPQGPGAS